MSFEATSFRSMDSRGNWCTITVAPATGGWRITWTTAAGKDVHGHAELDRNVRDRLRAALITSGVASKIPSAHVHVQGGGYCAAFDAGVLFAIVDPSRLHDGITGEAGLDGKFRPTTRYIEELNVPVEDLAELAPPRVDDIVRQVVKVP